LKLTALLSVVLVSLVGFYASRPSRGTGFDVEAGSIVDRPEYAADSIVVRAAAASDLDGVAAFATTHGYAVSERDDELTALGVSLPAGTNVVSAIADFVGAPGVLFAEPTYQLYRADSPSDPLYSRQSTYLSKVKAPQAWDIEQGRPEVIVAVLDSGVDISHQDLVGRIWANPLEIAGNSLDDDANGCVDDVNGCAFVTEPHDACARAVNGAVTDEVGHGTFVSGIIAATGDNNQGIVGVARNVTIMPVKVLDCAGSGTSLALAQGVLYAAKNGASVLNISAGGSTDSQIMRDAVRQGQHRQGRRRVSGPLRPGAGRRRRLRVQPGQGRQLHNQRPRG
jgi:subtilisin family serine protease